jgi:hypothetical protein
MVFEGEDGRHSRASFCRYLPLTSRHDWSHYRAIRSCERRVDTMVGMLGQRGWLQPNAGSASLRVSA